MYKKTGRIWRPVVKEGRWSKEALWPRIRFCIRCAIKNEASIQQMLSRSLCDLRAIGVVSFSSILSLVACYLTICVTGATQ